MKELAKPTCRLVCKSATPSIDTVYQLISDPLFSSSSPASIKPDWVELVSEDQLDEICLRSESTPVVILKHSTRCSISRFVLKDLVNSWSEPAADVPFYYLDLLSYRSISDAIALRFGVEHQSPQLLLIRKGRCVFSETHDSISADQVSSFLKGIA